MQRGYRTMATVRGRGKEDERKEYTIPLREVGGAEGGVGEQRRQTRE